MLRVLATAAKAVNWVKLNMPFCGRDIRSKDAGQ
jgi:hypothetical protein